VTIETMPGQPLPQRRSVTRLRPRGWSLGIVLAALLASNALAAEREQVGCYDAQLSRFHFGEGMPPCGTGEKPARLIDGTKIEMLPDEPPAATLWSQLAEVLSTLLLVAMVMAPGGLLFLMGVLALGASRGRGWLGAVGVALLLVGIGVSGITCTLIGGVGWRR
jgi:hypothetical protein